MRALKISHWNYFGILGRLNQLLLWRSVALLAFPIGLGQTIISQAAITHSIFPKSGNVSTTTSTPDLSQVEFDRVEESTVYFKSASGAPLLKPLKTNLYDLSFLGSLRPSRGGLPYFFFSGKPCQNCQVDKEIYSLRPSSEKPVTFVYPGKILDPASKKLLFESRAFFGQCLAHHQDVYVVFQRELVDRKRQRRLMSSVFIAEPGQDYFQENLIERRLPSLGRTLQLVRSKKCREIDGRNRFMLSKPLDLHPHDNGDSDDPADDSDDAPSPVEERT
jgi:hypothetical protein